MDSKDHHQSRQGCSPTVNSSIDAIQCHIQQVCSLDFRPHRLHCWNFHRIDICSMVHLVNRLNCLWQIHFHRSNSVAIYQFQLCHTKYWWHNSYQCWIDMHILVLVALLLRHIHQIYTRIQIHPRHHRMNRMKCMLVVLLKSLHPMCTSFHLNGILYDREP